MKNEVFPTLRACPCCKPYKMIPYWQCRNEHIFHKNSHMWQGTVPKWRPHASVSKRIMGFCLFSWFPNLFNISQCGHLFIVFYLFQIFRSQFSQYSASLEQKKYNPSLHANIYSASQSNCNTRKKWNWEILAVKQIKAAYQIPNFLIHLF